jgi:pimeloyl-ACP methyl ester carboxylesterase
MGETERLFDLNGIAMHVRIDGEGEALLLLHGFTGSGADWRHVFKNRPDGFRTIVPDLRGHGRSTNPARTFTHRQAALDVFALLDRLGVDRFNAIGMSTGGKTLLHMATSRPERVAAMVLVSATPHFPSQARRLFGQFTLDAASQDDWTRLRGTHLHGDDQIRLLYEQGRAFATTRDDMNFTGTHLSGISARTLIVHGDRDPYYPVGLALDLYAAIPQSWLWVVPNGGHGPIFGAMAEQFATASTAFLRGEWSGTVTSG